MTSIKTKNALRPHAQEKQTVKMQEVTGKSCTITNSTGVEIVVINAYAKSADDTAELFEQTLQTLATSDGKKSIADGKSATVTLDSGQAVSNLIIARADTLSPLKVIDAPDSLATMPLEVTVTSDDFAAAAQAEKFHQSIVAFPSSDLGTGYADALNDDDPDAIKKFFSNQKGFEKVTLNLAVAFQTYYERFPFVYAAYNREHTYFLYASDGTAITYMGSLLLENSNVAPLDTANVLDKFTATFTDSTETMETMLTWADGEFANDASKPTICLRGLFVQRSMLTKKDTDSMLMATLDGTVDGKDILAYDKQIHKDKDGSYSGLDVLLHPDSTMDYLKIAGACVLALAVLLALGVVCKKIADVILSPKNPQPLTPEEIRAQKLELIKKIKVEVERIIKMVKPNAVLPDDVRVSIARYKDQVSDWLIEQQRKGMLDVIENQQKYLDQIIDKVNNPNTVEHITDNIEHVYDIINLNRNPKALEPHLKDLIETVKNNTRILNETMKNIKYQWDITVKNTIADAKQGIDRVTRQMDANETDRETIIEDKVPDVDIVEVD